MTSFQLLKGLTGIDSELLVSVEQQTSRQKETKSHRGMHRPFLLAALIALLLMLVGCAVVYVLSLNGIKLGEQLVTYDVINKMTALKPKDGSTYVSDAQKLRVIVDSGLSEKDMVKLVQSTSIGKTMKTRLPILLDNGVSITKQLQFWEKIFDFDADGSGKLNQREVRACLDSFPGGNNNPLEALMGITSSSGPAWTTAEKAAMWQSYNKQFSARKNPYDRKVGEKVKADINAAGEKDKEPEEKQTVQASTGLSTGNAEVDRILGLR